MSGKNYAYHLNFLNFEAMHLKKDFKDIFFQILEMILITGWKSSIIFGEQRLQIFVFFLRVQRPVTGHILEILFSISILKSKKLKSSLIFLHFRKQPYHILFWKYYCSKIKKISKKAFQKIVDEDLFRLLLYKNWNSRRLKIQQNWTY